MFSFFERLTVAFPKQEPNQPPKGLYQFCRHYCQGMVAPLLLMAVLAALIAVCEVALFGFMGKLVDWLSTKDPNTLLSDEASTLWGMGLMLLVIMPLLTLAYSLLIHQALLGNFPMAIRWSAHRYLLRQSVTFFANDFAGRVATKVMQTALSVRETVMKLLDLSVYVIVYFTSMVVLVAQADLRLIWPMLIWLLVYISIQLVFVPKLKKISTEQANARSLMSGRIVDSYTNIATVKLFSHSQREADYAQEGMEEFLLTVHKQMRLVTYLNVSVQMANYLLTFSIAFLSIYLWMVGDISVGAIAIAIALVLRLNGMAQWIMWEIGSLFENIGTVADGMATLTVAQTITDQVDAKPLRVTESRIHYRDIRFHYGEKTGVIEQLNLSIKAGEKIGLVGRSGAGKTTLVNLLLRFHDVEGGAILIDDQDISQVTQDSLRAQIGMVTQDTSLLHRSVRDNILYGRPDASEAQMLAAAKQAKAHDFILGLTDQSGRTGYDAHVGERGVKLSGGQRQRIAITRVLLKDAPILVLDEATSALDSEVEAAIQTSLNQLMEGKTVIAIAHRLSTIAAMDRLIVLDKGEIIEQGTHAELIQGKGIYSQLWAHQTGGFLGE
ncbi:ABC transporter ATP-binding protein [Agarivorans sp. MS3-6]|uniref:ABC transporter ATP-binding protein n=1 Tax=Agarivorans sp. TSD2052 TaxID=2937286 RepID=UPI00200E1152|nr:ABC transporter ATP-binding protein [Agarivorans sp. TSD2052]UPW18358.1 ABC transporter ATP-binding protein/permease [Agarivorans sp. TSD2052]